MKKDRYLLDFFVKQYYIICRESNINLSPEPFKIDKVYRFEGAYNPDDQSLLLAISSYKYNIKRVLVNGYGISTDTAIGAIIEQ